MYTILFSWAFWVVLILQSSQDDFTPYGVLYYVGGVGPLVASAGLTYFEKGWKGVKDIMRSSLAFNRLKIKDLALIILFSTLPNLLSVLILLPPGQPLIAMELSLESTLPWFVFLFIVSIVEETGWRGYALPRLLDSFSPLSSSLILGSLWALWHVPLFLLSGTWQNALGFMTPVFWSYMLQLLPRSLLMTWIFLKTRRSLASAVLFHTFVNLSGELFDVTARADLLRFVLEILLTLILFTILSKKDSMQHEP